MKWKFKIFICHYEFKWNFNIFTCHKFNYFYWNFTSRFLVCIYYKMQGLYPLLFLKLLYQLLIDLVFFPYVSKFFKYVSIWNSGRKKSAILVHIKNIRICRYIVLLTHLRQHCQRVRDLGGSLSQNSIASIQSSKRQCWE